MAFFFAGAALVTLFVARQSGFSSHWFFQSQAAYDLASGAARESLYWMARATDRTRAEASPFLSGPLVDVHAALEAEVAPSPPLILVSSARGDTLPPALFEAMAALEGFGAEVEVQFRLVEASSIPASGGIPADVAERRGRIQLRASATVTNALGISVTREVVVERNFKRVNLLPAVVGRFVLFSQQGPEVPPNFVRLQADSRRGNTTQLGPAPLEVVSGEQLPILRGRDLDPQRGVDGSSGPGFLDSQGWVYLGGGDWDLNLAQGANGLGESPLVPAYWDRLEIGGSAASDRQFQTNLINAATSTLCRIAPPGATTFPDPEDGAYVTRHGFAENFEVLGGRRRGVPRADLTIPEAGPGLASGLRLFGRAGRLSPTLVFGSVKRRFFEAGMIRFSFQPQFCPVPGKVVYILHDLDKYGAATQTLLNAGFGANWEQVRAKVVADDFSQALNVVLDPRVAGVFGAGGVLQRATGSSDRPLPVHASVHLPWFSGVPGDEGLPGGVRDNLRNGVLSSPTVFSGTCGQALQAFRDWADERRTFDTSPEVFPARFLADGILKVPGIVKVAGDLTIPALEGVEDGGIVIAEGKITIEGDLVSGGVEPLTLVSLGGNIEFSPNVSKVEAFLVAAGGKVLFPPQALEVTGGIVGESLDLTGIRDQDAPRKVTYASHLDPADPEARADAYRVYFGGEDRVAVLGPGSS